LARWCDDEFPQVQCWLLAEPYDAEPAELAKYADLKPPATVAEIFCANLQIADEGGFTLVINNVVNARPLLDRAIDAYGNLRPPAPGIETSPGSPSVVQLDTWFWLDANTFRETVGTPADGMVAIATPTNTTWEPGDGTGTIDCAGAGTVYATGATSTCTHTYRKASFSPQPTVDGKGYPAYQATVTRSYVVRYEFFGVPVIVPGARLDFAVTTPFPIAVAEVQTVNNGAGTR
jgi:hypothetical protein